MLLRFGWWYKFWRRSFYQICTYVCVAPSKVTWYFNRVASLRYAQGLICCEFFFSFKSLDMVVALIIFLRFIHLAEKVLCSLSESISLVLVRGRHDYLCSFNWGVPTERTCGSGRLKDFLLCRWVRKIPLLHIPIK